jgi:ferredoxin
MRVRLDSTKCSGHARCYAVSAELFPIDDAGYSALEDHEVASTTEAIVREGVAACPERALSIEEGD